MSKNEPVIVVSGDVTVDWFMYPVDTSDEGENWRLHTSSHADALPGGAALLTKFIRRSLEAERIKASVAGPQLPAPLRDIPPEKVIHSNVMLDRFQVRGVRRRFCASANHLDISVPEAVRLSHCRQNMTSRMLISSCLTMQVTGFEITRMSGMAP